jgi:O-antigen ligase
MTSDRTASRLPSPTTGKGRFAEVSVFTILVSLQASAAMDNIASFIFPSLIDTAIQAVSRIIWFSLYVYALVSLFVRYGAAWTYELTRSRFSLLFMVLFIACLSPLWSLDPALSIQRVVHLVGTTLIGIFIGYHVEQQRLLSSLFVALAILVAVGAVAAISVPTLGQDLYEGEAAWRGLQNEKNAFGFAAAILALLALCRMQALPWARQRTLCVATFLIAVLSLLESNSMTSTAALALGMAVVACDVLARRLRMPILATVCLALASISLTVMVVAVSGFDQTEDWAKLVGRSSDLSGRTDIWLPVWRLALDRPLLGYGYGALWFPRIGLEGAQQSLFGLTWTAYSAHNSFLQLASEIGLPAALSAIAFALVSLGATIRLHALRSSPSVLFVIAFQSAFLLASLFEAHIFIDRSLMWILFVALPLAAQRSYQRLLWLPDVRASKRRADLAAIAYEAHPRAN